MYIKLGYFFIKMLEFWNSPEVYENQISGLFNVT